MDVNPGRLVEKVKKMLLSLEMKLALNNGGFALHIRRVAINLLAPEFHI